MPIEALEQQLDAEKKRLGAGCCTFYVRDPYWPDEFRLICMPGVKIREPMHGFVFTDRARMLISTGSDELYCSDIATSPQPEDETSRPPAAIKPELAYLFEDFARREGISSFARLFHKGDNQSPDAVLFVNFEAPKLFTDELKAEMRSLLAKAAANLDLIAEELRTVDAEHLAETIRILNPAQALAKSFHAAGSGELELKQHFEKVLSLSLKALGIPESEGLGTIHLFESEKGILDLKASWGNAPKISEAKTLAVSSGQGVISWVALKRKVLLIENLGTSDFGRIKVIANENVKSELAVPMIADGELVGVLNLESTRESAFQRASVRSIWYAANNAALAFQLARKTSATRRLLSICEAATKDKDGARLALNDIADVMSQTLSANACDIWHYNSYLGRLDAAGATYPDFVPAVRSNGWSRYIWENKQPVWLSKIVSEALFSPLFWSPEGWNPTPLTSGEFPQDINQKVLDSGAQAELGLPIMVDQDCVGVAWIKYLHNCPPPRQKRMNEAFSVASQAGLVLELVQRQVERPDRVQLQNIAQKLKIFFASCALDFGSLPLEGYIIHRPFHAHSCGDFHILSHVDNSVMGLLIGDGEGKAVSGLLNALPLITGFEAFSNGSGSTRHVIDKLRTVSRKLGLSGTALYWTFTKIGPDVWLAMTSAGHVLPILVRREHQSMEGRTFPRQDSPALGTTLGVPLDLPQGEHHEKLQSGDILIAYTDGVTDAWSNRASDQIEQPVGKIISLAMAEQSLSCKELAEAIMSAAEKANPLLDDATVCVIRHK